MSCSLKGNWSPNSINWLVPDMSGMVKPLPSIHEQALTKTDQHLQGENIFNGNISEDHYGYLASEKELATSASSVGIASTFVTRFLARTKYGLWILIATKILVLLTVTLGVLGGLGYLSPHFGSDLAVSAPSVGATRYPGTSNGTATPGHFDMSGSGDGTYYGIVILFLLILIWLSSVVLFPPHDHRSKCWYHSLRDKRTCHRHGLCFGE